MSDLEVAMRNVDDLRRDLGVDDCLISHLRPRVEMPTGTPRRGRGKSAETVALVRVAHDILKAAPSSMTLRQLYYALVSASTIPKTEAAYGQLKRVMRDAREDGSVPWEWLVDHTRSVFAPRTWDGLEGLLDDSARLYRRDLMRQQKVAIQMWAESDSVGSVIARVADRYTIPTFIGRGYAARGYLWSAAQDAIAAQQAGKKVVILHVGDHDPSGEDIFRDVEQTLRLYALTLYWGLSPMIARGWGRALSVAEVRRSVEHDATLGRWYGATFADELESWTLFLAFKRLVLTPDQVEQYDLPVRPPKASDVRTGKFAGRGAVEVEALPVEALLAVVEQAIRSYLDPQALKAAETAEASERAIAARIAVTPIERLLKAAS